MANLPGWMIWAGTAGLAAALCLVFGGLWLVQRRTGHTAAPAGHAPGDGYKPTTNDRAAEAGAYSRQALPAAQDRPPVPAGVGGGGVDVLSPGAWLTIAIDKVVHLMLVGETGSGKSTVANALLYARARAECIVIIDPHADQTTWGGLLAIGTGRSYPAIERALLDLEAEMTARYERKAAGQPWGDPVSIFIDEYPTIAANCKQAAGAFKALAREGRKVGMRMVILTQDANVKTLGIEGEGPVRDNFSRVLLGAFAVKEVAGLAGLEYPAALDHKGKVAAIDTSYCQRFAGLAIDPARLWQPPTPEPAPIPAPLAARAFDLDAELTRFLTGAQPAPGSDSEGEPTAGVEAVRDEATAVLADTDAVNTGTADLPQDELSRAIRALVSEKISRNKIIEWLPIPGGKDGRSGQLRRIREALGEAVE